MGGWYGATAIESFAMGRPVISFIRPSFLHYVDRTEDELPIINANRDTIYDTLKKVHDYTYDQLEEIALSGHNYVTKMHSKEYVAKKVLNIYNSLWE